MYLIACFEINLLVPIRLKIYQSYSYIKKSTFILNLGFYITDRKSENW